MPEVDQLSLLWGWCQEAVEQFGADWPKIRAYVQNRIDEMPPDARDSLESEAGSLLRAESMRQVPSGALRDHQQ